MLGARAKRDSEEKVRKMSDPESEDFDSDEFEDDSDRELQEQFAKGILKPGLNVPVEVKKEPINNVKGLRQKLHDIKQNLDWIERLDVTTDLAPIAPEMAVYISEKEGEAESGKVKVTKSLDPTLDDFKREMNFHRQAQAAVLEAIPRLHKLGIRTKRPDDYFAQMAKSDEHMQKIRTSLLKQKAGQEISEKVKKIRENRKVAKQLQVQAQLQKQKDKKDLMEEVKKYRKGIRKDLDFLEPGGGKKPGQQQIKQSQNFKNNKPGEKKRKKDQKYGFGGKKRGLKTNTSTSSANVPDYRPPKKSGGKNARKGGAKNQRPGKGRRNQNKPKRR